MNKLKIRALKKKCLSCWVDILEIKHSNIGIINHLFNLKEIPSYDKRIFICRRCYNKGVVFEKLDGFEELLK